MIELCNRRYGLRCRTRPGLARLCLNGNSGLSLSLLGNFFFAYLALDSMNRERRECFSIASASALLSLRWKLADAVSVTIQFYKFVEELFR